MQICKALLVMVCMLVGMCYAQQQITTIHELKKLDLPPEARKEIMLHELKQMGLKALLFKVMAISSRIPVQQEGLLSQADATKKLNDIEAKMQADIEKEYSAITMGDVSTMVAQINEALAKACKLHEQEFTQVLESVFPNSRFEFVPPQITVENEIIYADYRNAPLKFKAEILKYIMAAMHLNFMNHFFRIKAKIDVNNPVLTLLGALVTGIVQKQSEAVAALDYTLDLTEKYEALHAILKKEVPQENLDFLDNPTLLPFYIKIKGKVEIEYQGWWEWTKSWFRK